MARTKLPDARFEAGILIRYRAPSTFGAMLTTREDWHVIGRVDDGTPFLLDYRGGVTHWQSAATLGDSLRKKILGFLREQLRRADSLPAYICFHDLSTDPDWEQARNRAGAIEIAFLRDVWRATYLLDRDEDYVALAVPFAEKDQAKALGAKWDGAARVWRVKRRPDMSPFERWMPAEEHPEEHSDSGAGQA